MRVCSSYESASLARRSDLIIPKLVFKYPVLMRRTDALVDVVVVVCLTLTVAGTIALYHLDLERTENCDLVEKVR